MDRIEMHRLDPENFRDRVTLKKVSDIENPSKQMKILFIGNSGVGKSSLVHRLRKNEFRNAPHEPTLSFTPTLVAAECERINYLVELQDTAGQEKYSALFRDFYRHAHGAMIVYDITDYNSYEKIKYWTLEVKKQIQSDTARFPFLLLGNKVDKNERHINGTNVAEDLGINGFIRTSAKSGEGIRDAVKLMIGLIITTYTDQELEVPPENSTINLPARTLQQQGGYRHVHSAPEERKCCVI